MLCVTVQGAVAASLLAAASEGPVLDDLSDTTSELNGFLMVKGRLQMIAHPLIESSRFGDEDQTLHCFDSCS